MIDMLFFGNNKWRGKGCVLSITQNVSIKFHIWITFQFIAVYSHRRKQLAQLGSATGVYKTLVKYLVGVPQVLVLCSLAWHFFACNYLVNHSILWSPTYPGLSLVVCVPQQCVSRTFVEVLLL